MVLLVVAASLFTGLVARRVWRDRKRVLTAARRELLAPLLIALVVLRLLDAAQRLVLVLSAPLVALLFRLVVAQAKYALVVARQHSALT